ncbi:hypothetical protein [Fructilactobacillus frigidiflavus]|uniref:hypothetical protein n=1 Tax=Fructilactobacillus frigidiflavus TaxID=3242688 RepID=UPI0037580EDF
MKPKFTTTMLYLVIIFNLVLLTGIFKPKHHQKVSASMDERSQMTINVQDHHHYKTNKRGNFVIHTSLVIGNQIHFQATNPDANVKITKSGSNYKTTVNVPNQQSTEVTIYSTGKELTDSAPVTITVKNNQK